MTQDHPSRSLLSIVAILSFLVSALVGCVATTDTVTGQNAIAPIAPGQGIDDLILVDCLLPGQIRQLGTRMTYLAPRRSVKSTKSDCGIRGGEFVLFDRSDYGSALRTLLPKAQGGDPVAQTYVGEIYEKGLGLAAPDPASAASWYRKAAEKNHGPAQINLGALYEQGLGVPQDKAQALEWYRRASGLTEDRLIFESTLKAQQTEFKREIALRQQVAAALRQQLKKASATRPSEPRTAQVTVKVAPVAPVAQVAPVTPVAQVAPVTPITPMVPVTPVTQVAASVEPAQLRHQAVSQRLDIESEAERKRKEVHAVEQLKQSDASAGKSAQLGKLELVRNEQYRALLDTSRQLAQQ